MKKNDLLIIAIGFVLALVIYGGLELNNRLQATDDKVLAVYIDGEMVDSFPLDEPMTKTYDTDRGYNIIEIDGESAHIREANCPNQSCVHDGHISRVNETVVCLPHHFHIQIEGNEEVEIDAISE